MLIVKASHGARQDSRASITQADRTVTLRIKRRYMDAIESGSKRTEYRACNDYYSRLFLRPFNRLKLHYQTARKLMVEVTGVRVIELDGETVFAIDLGQVIQ